MEGGKNLRYEVLGHVRAYRDSSQLELGGPKQRLVLALLLSHFGERVSIDSLIDGVWRDVPPDSGRKTLHVYISNLRSAGVEIETGSGGYRIDSGVLDSFEFGLMTRDAEASSSAADRAQMLGKALALWSGSAYSDVAGEHAIVPEANRLNELRVGVIEDRVDADLAAGDASTLVGELVSLTREYPYRERFYGQLMLALYRSGRQAESLRVFRKARQLLVEELGIEPGPDLRELEDRVLLQDPSLALPSSDASSAQSIRGYELRGELDVTDQQVRYEAFDRAGATRVLISEFKNTDDPAEVGTFEVRARRLAGLDHPNIVPLVDFWREPEHSYLVHSYVHGVPLIEPPPQGLDATLRIISDVGRGLAYAHRQGVVHGQLEAADCLVLEDRTMVTRFVLTTPSANEFSAPEVVSGERPDRRSDIYSLARLAESLAIGAPASLTEVFAIATSRDPSDRYPRTEDFLRAIKQATGTDVSGPAEGDVAPLPNPYKGLRAFQEADANDFFGRTAVVERLLARFAAGPLVAVVGPSGCGKSSVVKAGLVPVLRRSSGNKRLITEMYPGTFPFEELEAALLRVSTVPFDGDLHPQLTADSLGLVRVIKQILQEQETELVLIIDQFEELFSLTSREADRDLFLDALSELCVDARGRTKVIVTLRADFFDRPLDHRTFGRHLERGAVAMASPSRDDLALAVSQPGHNVGIEYEEGLVGEIVADVVGQSGGLPLMQFALTDLADRRTTDLISVDDYRSSGGVAGAMTRRAEEIFQSLTNRGRDAIGLALLRMVTISEDGDVTRRRVSQLELAGLDVDQTALREAIRLFGAARLLTFDRDPITRGPTIEVAHEAMMREWDRYSGWVEQHREGLILHRRLRTALTEWLEADRNPGFLPTGSRLAQFEEWSVLSDVTLTDNEREFLAVARDAEVLARSRSRRRRMIISAVAGAALVAIVAAGAFGLSERREARSESLAGIGFQALTDVPNDPEASMLVALAAADIATAEGIDVPGPVIEALHGSLSDLRITKTVPGGGALSMNPAGDRYAVVLPGSDGWVLEIRQASDDTLLGAVDAGRLVDDQQNSLPLGALAWDSSGHVVAYLDTEGVLRVWESDSMEEAVGATLVAPPNGGVGDRVSVAFVREGSMRLVAVARENVPSYGLIDLETSKILPPVVLLDINDNGVSALATSPDGRHLAIGTTKGTTFVTASPRDPLTSPDVAAIDAIEGRVADIDWVGNEQIAVAEGGGIPVWDVATGDAGSASLAFVLKPRGGFVTSVVADQEANLVVTGGDDGLVQTFFLVAPGSEDRPWVELLGHDAPITDVAIDGAGIVFTSSLGDSTVRHWDVSLAGRGELGTLALDPWGYLSLMEFSGDGGMLVANVAPPGGEPPRGAVVLWDASTWDPAAQFTSAHFGGMSEFSGDSRYLAVQNGAVGTEIDAATFLDPRLGTTPTVTDIYDLRAGSLVSTAAGRTSHTQLMVFSPDSSVLATADMDGSLRLWSVSDGTLVDAVDTAQNIGGLDYTTDGNQIALGNEVGTITIYDADTLDEIRTFGGHEMGVFDVRFFDDDRKLLTSSFDTTLGVWDVGSGKRLLTLSGHRSVPWAISINDDETLAASSSQDGTRLWDLATGETKTLFDTAELPVGTAFHPTEGYLAVGDATRGVVYRYEMDTDALITLARSRATRSLSAQECVIYRIDPCPAAIQP
jgi:WD40 repeat protein/DNA-binding SARP family transcriptional activator/energy-coupling factor transporter ATP-binding protein EcfA2